MRFLNSRIKKFILSYIFLVITLYSSYHFFWGQHSYLITAYCDCPICINIKEFHDGKFASGKKVYWGGIAADKKVRFGSDVELVPFSPINNLAVWEILRGRKKFIVEDRGGKIKGRHIDLFIPDSMGGHKTALKWGVRRMRIKINGHFAD